MMISALLAAIVPLSSLDLSSAVNGWGKARSRVSVLGKPLEIAGRPYADGVGVHAPSSYEVDVDGKARAFSAEVGIDSAVPDELLGSVRFRVIADGRLVTESPVLRYGQPPHSLKTDLTGVRHVTLEVTDGGDGVANDLADWCNATFEMADDGTKPVPVVHSPETEQFGVLTPPAEPAPRINPPYAFGVRPNHPILFTLPVSGVRPMEMSVSGLPDGAAFDGTTGRLSGRVKAAGEYRLVFTARNAHGECRRDFLLSVGRRLALTPPMGWSSWNCYGAAVSEEKIRRTAELMVTKGLVNYGWSYVNIDDYWQNYVAGDGKFPDIAGKGRRPCGRIAVNGRFGCLRKLTDHIHSLGLKAGIYSSPGPRTCGGCVGSWRHEARDASDFAKWGFDYLKYDWCSYTETAVGDGLMYRMAPYLLMGRALDAQDRDIVFSLCQYGRGNVQTWGAITGGHCWRTTQDIRDNWTSLKSIVDHQRDAWMFAGPGAWNDPDMLIVGKVGGWEGASRPTGLTPNEQYSHLTWWCLMAAPLMIGCDLAQLDDLTLSLLTNPEVLEIDQDPLGAAAACIQDGIGCPGEVWLRPLADGSFAVGLFNVSPAKAEIAFDLSAAGLLGSWRVRDLWRRRDLGEVCGSLRAILPSHAPQFVRLTPDPTACVAEGVGDVRDGFWRRLFNKHAETGVLSPCMGCGR